MLRTTDRGDSVGGNTQCDDPRSLIDFLDGLERDTEPSSSEESSPDDDAVGMIVVALVEHVIEAADLRAVRRVDEVILCFCESPCKPPSVHRELVPTGGPD